MSRQSSLNRYFKCKSSPACLKEKSSFSPATSPIMSDKNITKKRRSLSLVKNSTPKKAPKIINHNVTIEEVVNLCSDDENATPIVDDNQNMSENFNTSQASISSETTIIYNITPSTPKKSPKASSSTSFHSPNSNQKYFSPNKKRAVFKRTPVKRNLVLDNFDSSSQLKHNSVEDEEFSKACEGMDDKSIFLLTIVNKCVKDDSLRKVLDEKSIELLTQYLTIIKPGARLVCRLYWRQQGWYKKEKLIQITSDKNEIIGESQFFEMLNCLVENGLVKQSANFGTNSMAFDDLVKVLKSEEIKQVCKDFKLKFQSKLDAESALRCFSQQKSISNYFSKATAMTDNSKRVLDSMRSKAGTCYRLSDFARSTLDKLHLLMYLGINYEAIRDKRLELMLINNKIKRETYPIDIDMKLDNASVVFRSKEEFESYWNAHVIYEDYLANVDSSKKCCIIKKVCKLYEEIDEEDMTRYKALPTWLRRFTPAHLYVKMLESGVQELKKDDHFLALEILTTLLSQIAFRQHKRAEWYAEKALVLHKLMARHDEAAEVLIEGLTSSLPEEAKDALRPRASKIARQQNIQLAPGLEAALHELATEHLILEKTFHAHHVWKPHMETTNQRGKKKFEVHTEDGKKFLDAENYCILDYTKNGDFTHGEHWEGRIATTIYYLLFWDIIYAKPRGVVGVFLSHYQLHPLDMYDESFYLNRKTLIEDRLMRIEAMTTDEMVQSMLKTWDERPESELSGIHRNLGREKVRAVGACLGPRAAAALCRRLAANYMYAHSGFPDLTLWNIHTNKIKFVEVKTDSDKPSMKQLQWMRYLRENDIDTGFCYVGVASARCRARGSGPPVKITVKSVSQINSNSDTNK